MSDVVTAIEIDRPRDVVARYAGDPENAMDWYANITAVERDSSGPLAVGSRVAFVARFLGRRMSYTYEITELIPGQRLVMAADAAPFPMETTYTWEDTQSGGTRMTLRNRGGPSGLLKLAEPVMTAAIRRATRKDLARLKTILESAELAGAA